MERVRVPWWDKLHWWVGRLVFLAALVNICVGINYAYSQGILSGSISIPVVTCLVFAGGFALIVYGELFIGRTSRFIIHVGSIYKENNYIHAKLKELEATL